VYKTLLTGLAPAARLTHIQLTWTCCGKSWWPVRCKWQSQSAYNYIEKSYTQSWKLGGGPRGIGPTAPNFLGGRVPRVP